MAIKILDKNLIEKIAAGEVVERPSSVVKELIENSLDANSTNISIEIIEGGCKLIRVTDNGIGMDDQDAITCFKQHATSKINSEDDLFNIATLGFRGEAIPSIASVSKVTLFTRKSDSENGIKIINHGGNILSKESCGRPKGTTIIVEDLFYNIPARLKFLKKPSTEAAQISAIISKYILARPDIAFRFVSSGKEIYRSTGDNSLKNAIFAVYGEDTVSHIIPINFEYDYITIKGYLGMPEIARVSKNTQNLFVNKRYIKSEQISSAIKQGYLNRIMPAKNPFFAVNLSIPFDKLDVNVHPNKMDVRFIDSDLIYECFYKATKTALDDFYNKQNKEVVSSPVKENNFKPVIKEDNSLLNDVSSFFEHPYQVNENEDLTIEDENFEQTSSILVKQVVSKFTENKMESIMDEANKSAQIGFLPKEDLDDYKIIGQLFNTYILIEYKDKFIIIDQHAAHERINTQILLEEFDKGEIPKQSLLFPKILKLTQEDMSVVIDNIDLINSLGFDVQDFSSSTLKIDAVPHIFGEENVEQFFYETLDNIKQNKNAKIETRKNLIFQSACKHSVKAGSKLSDIEINKLIKETLENDSPLNCPHGRPIVVIKTKYEIEKWFLRIV